MESVPEGKRIIKEARERDPDLLAKIHRGDVSFTESTFARSYSLLDGKEQMGAQARDHFKPPLETRRCGGGSRSRAVHFSEKEMLDPYKPGFELKQFVKRGIEGQGGELSALERECEVAWALRRKYPSFPRHRLCVPYQAEGGGFNRKRALEDYYALGEWFANAPKALIEQLPVTNRRVVFTSSYARKPYPVALAEEYAATREVACANNRRKYKLIAAQADSGRSPASSNLLRERRRLRHYDLLYCRAVKAEKR